MSNLSQSSISGPNIGRDQYNINTARPRHRKLSALFAKLELEYENDNQFTETLEELDRLTSPKVDKVIGLEEKLKLGNRSDLYEYALEVKELYAKRLVRYQLYRSAQKVNIYLLALTITYFKHHIAPLIQSGSSDAFVDRAIANEIINPLMSMLEDDMIIDFNSEHITGMLYYLTGNCHINWS